MHSKLKVPVLRPIFVEVMPEFKLITEGFLWISLTHRTINFRCPCGCGELTVLSIRPTRWHVLFDGECVSLNGRTGGSVWTSSSCGSHYFIKRNKVIWSDEVHSVHRAKQQRNKRSNVFDEQVDSSTRQRWFKRICRTLSMKTK